MGSGEAQQSLGVGHLLTNACWMTSGVWIGRFSHSSAWGGNFKFPNFSVSLHSYKGNAGHAICIMLFNSSKKN